MAHVQRSLVASPEQRAAALEMIFRRKGEMPAAVKTSNAGRRQDRLNIGRR